MTEENNTDLNSDKNNGETENKQDQTVSPVDEKQTERSTESATKRAIDYFRQNPTASPAEALLFFQNSENPIGKSVIYEARRAVRVEKSKDSKGIKIPKLSVSQAKPKTKKRRMDCKIKLPK